MSVWKQISASVQAIAASLAGTLTVAAHAVTQSGTWTVQPGNTANTTAWKVDGSAVTQPVSGTVTANAGTGNHAVTAASGSIASGAISSGAVASGAFASGALASGSVASGALASGSIADGASVTIGAKADAKSTATDTTSITAMSVWKQISASVQAIATSLGAAAFTRGAGAVDANTLRVTVDNTQTDGSEYETVAASTTATLGGAGAAGDFLSGVLIVPSTTSPGKVQIKDGSNTAIDIFNGGASSVSNLVPFFVPLGITSTNGAWQLITLTNETAIGVGNFT